MTRLTWFPLFLLLGLAAGVFAQPAEKGQLHGNFQMDMISYQNDSLIKAHAAPEKVLLNSYANFIYSQGHFSAGLRFESYLNTLQGYDQRNNGQGIPYRFVTYSSEPLEITVGNFYEQFGNGLILRTFVDKTIDFDNAIEGIRVKFDPLPGFSLKGIMGRQRLALYDPGDGISSLENGPGLVRGIDGEFQLNTLIPGLAEKETQWILGGSFVSKFQKDDNPLLKLPENVGAYAARLNMASGPFNFGAEYAYKVNDPSADNNLIYKDGEALLLNLTYSKKGFGVYFNAKRVDNMSFRTDRNAVLNSLMINSLPPISKNIVYSLPALYPYSTQPNGEVGSQAEVMYKFKEGTGLGGKYGTKVSLGYSRVNGLEKTAVSDGRGYFSEFLSLGDEVYFQDVNLEVTKKFSPTWKAIFLYQNLTFNYAVIRGEPGYPTVKANSLVADVTCRFTPKKALRTEFQWLGTEEDRGDWAMVLAEYSVAPHWYFTLSDMYNYGNEDVDQRIHYYMAAVAYVYNTSRIQIGYNKLFEGIVCVGGVCRTVPAQNGLSVSISSSF